MTTVMALRVVLAAMLVLFFAAPVVFRITGDAGYFYLCLGWAGVLHFYALFLGYHIERGDRGPP